MLIRLKAVVRTAGAVLTTLIVLGGCGSTPPPPAPSWHLATENAILDLVHVVSPQPYVDTPDPAGDLNGIADATVVLAAAGAAPAPADLEGFRHDGLYGTFDPWGQTALAVRATLGVKATPSAPGAADAIAVRTRMFLRAGRGFIDPKHPVATPTDPAATVRVLELLDLVRQYASPAGRTMIDQQRADAHIPGVCDRLAVDAASAVVLLRLVDLQHDACPAAALAVHVGGFVDAPILADPLAPESQERLLTVRSLIDLGAFDVARAERLGEAVAHAVVARYASPGAADTATDMAQVRNLLDLATALKAEVKVPPGIVAAAQRLVRWRGSIFATDPHGQAVTLWQALATLRVLAATTHDTAQYTRLVDEVRKVTDLNRLTKADILTWQAATLGTRSEPIPFDDIYRSNDLLLAAFGIISRTRPPGPCPGRQPAAMRTDIETLAKGASGSSPSPVLRLAVMDRILQSCGMTSPSDVISGIVRHQVAQSSTATARPSLHDLFTVAEAACLTGNDPAPLRPIAEQILRAARVPSGGAAEPPAKVPTIQSTYEFVGLDELTGRSCKFGWWDESL